MKKTLTLVFCLVLSVLGTVIVAQEANLNSDCIRVCTYNIRGDLPNDGINSWKYRKDSLCNIIKKHNFDIVCMQEVLANQLEDIQSRIHYEFVGVRGLYNPIFYKAERFELLHNEIFWLSETMIPFSKGWDGRYDRYCVWAKFKDRKSGEIFYVFNTHLDHKGNVAKYEGAKLVCAEAKKYAGDYPVIICGDMNSFDTTDTYRVYTENYKDSRIIADVVCGPVGTGHNFGKVVPVRIDYIFVNNNFKVTYYDVEDEQYENGFYPSDHYAVFIDAHLKR